MSQHSDIVNELIKVAEEARNDLGDDITKESEKMSERSAS